MHHNKHQDYAKIITASDKELFNIINDQTYQIQKPQHMHPQLTFNQTQDDELLLQQFYKKEENPILFNLYKVICENSNKELTYTDICNKYNQTFATRKRS